MSNPHIYLDYNSTTPLDPTVIETIKKHMKDFGNPSSLHYHGQRAKVLIEESRQRIAEAIGAQQNQILFESSGSEINNHLLYSYARQSSSDYPVHILISSIEHACIRSALNWSEYPHFSISTIPVHENGRVDLATIPILIRPETRLISVMAVNNELGTIQPLKDIIQIAKKHDCKVHTDAIQAIGKTPFSVQEYPVDFATFSAHKCYGPKGIAALYAKQDTQLLPLIQGGPQEFVKRAGTENTLGIVGMATAMQLCTQQVQTQIKQDTHFKHQILDAIKHQISDYWINGSTEHSVANTLNLSFPSIDGTSLAMKLDLHKIGIATGSACSTGSIDPSPILQTLYQDPQRIEGAIRISWGRFTTEKDINTLISTLPKLIKAS